ncbi:MAG: hypothetical protein ACREF1_00300, partial [Acetobacteraceae bacterium]
MTRVVRCMKGAMPWGEFMADTELAYLDLIELTRRIHAKEISPVEATKAQLARIDKFDGALGSYALVTPELALKQA